MLHLSFIYWSSKLMIMSYLIHFDMQSNAWLFEWNASHTEIDGIFSLLNMPESCLNRCCFLCVLLHWIIYFINWNFVRLCILLFMTLTDANKFGTMYWTISAISTSLIILDIEFWFEESTTCRWWWWRSWSVPWFSLLFFRW